MSNNLFSLFKHLKRGDHHARYGHHGHDGHYSQHPDREYGHYHGNHDEHFHSSLMSGLLKELAGELYRNKRIALLVIILILSAVFLFLLGVVWLGAKLIQLSGPLLADVEKNGLKGVVELITQATRKVWEGAGK